MRLRNIQHFVQVARVIYQLLKTCLSILAFMKSRATSNNSTCTVLAIQIGHVIN